jgi:putative ABC transport system permease protein
MIAGFINWLAQVLAVTGFNIRSLPQRLGSSVTAVIGIAGVVAVMVGVLSIAEGIRKTMTSSAAADNAIVLRSGSTSEMTSGLTGDEARIIADAPAIARSEDGPLASAELYVIIDRPKLSTGTEANVPLRGVTRSAFAVRDRFQLIEGRPFEWGLKEVIAGVGASGQFAGLRVGDQLPVSGELWPVVGIMAADGGIAESEIWADAAVLQPAFRRGNSYQSVFVKLASVAGYDEFKDALTSDPRLNVKVQREADFYAAQTTVTNNLITGLGTSIAAIMGLGAIFGALNTMYTAVAARSREIATLRALGFRSGPVVISVLTESLILALVGGGIGGLLAYLAFDGIKTASLNWVSFSQMTFAFDVTASLLVQGILFALLIGLIGGLFPAVRAARMPVATALREQ